MVSRQDFGGASRRARPWVHLIVGVKSKNSTTPAPRGFPRTLHSCPMPKTRPVLLDLEKVHLRAREQERARL
jgi:hypothetical protein